VLGVSTKDLRCASVDVCFCGGRFAVSCCDWFRPLFLAAVRVLDWYDVVGLIVVA
jgi:hypothetical protein